MITDFHELAEPVCDEHSGIAGAEWYVRIKDVEPYYLMVANQQLGNLMRLPNEEFYFSTEADAHAAGYMYYQYYNKAYPYVDAWLATVAVDVDDVIDDNDDGSQVMNFI